MSLIGLHSYANPSRDEPSPKEPLQNATGFFGRIDACRLRQYACSLCFLAPSQRLFRRKDGLPNRAGGVDSGSIAVLFEGAEIRARVVDSVATRDALGDSVRLVETKEALSAVGILVAIAFTHSEWQRRRIVGVCKQWWWCCWLWY